MKNDLHMYSIKKVDAEEIYPVRHPVLRPGKPFESCIFDGDNLSSTAHFACFDEKDAIGAVSVFENNSTLFASERQYQLRGMAVLETYQKKGIGNQLVRFAEDYIKTQNGELIWFNARIIAVMFYEKLGYKIIGEAFNIGDIGLHYVMYKEIV
jgi:GNAT superfamily N-acetyltransferase